MPKGLKERLQDGECILAAEGYVIELEARGYLKAGGFVPEVVLEHPEVVRQLHLEFVHAGSDVVLALTYYAHREKLRLLGRENDLVTINKKALQIARSVADETGCLMAGNICNSNVLNKDDPASLQYVKDMFREQLQWAVEGGADYIVAETFDTYAEAALALEACKEVAPALPRVITLSVPPGGLFDGVGVPEACKLLEDAGATVVGLNCSRGPATMLPLLKEIHAVCKGPLAAVPVGYRTSEAMLTYQALETCDCSGKPAFPLELSSWACTRPQIKQFTEEAKALGVQYLGLCCGNRSFLLREMAVAAGKLPAACKYAPDMSQHYTRVNKDSEAAKAFTGVYSV